MEGILPYDVWCEISRHIPAGDLNMLFKFRMICRDSNGAVNILLSRVTKVGKKNSFDTITVNGVYHGERFLNSLAYSVSYNYYYGILHGKSSSCEQFDDDSRWERNSYFYKGKDIHNSWTDDDWF